MSFNRRHELADVEVVVLQRGASCAPRNRIILQRNPQRTGLPPIVLGTGNSRRSEVCFGPRSGCGGRDTVEKFVMVASVSAVSASLGTRYACCLVHSGIGARTEPIL